MTDTQQGVILLLKSAVTGRAYPLPAGFSIAEAARLARAHHIVPLVYTGAVTCGVPSRDVTMQQLFTQHLAALVKSENQLLRLERLTAAFDEAGIDYMPLKGMLLKHMYPRPDLRVMGDADILIRLEQYDRIRPILESQGFKEQTETDHELIWNDEELCLELHKHLIPSYNRDYYDYFGNGWQLAAADAHGRCAMDPEDTFIFLLVHFAKHYRDGGAGCRNILDFWIYRQAHPDLDETRIHRALSLLRLGEFYENTLRLMDHWFCDGPGDPVLEHMAAYIFSGGMWGDADTKQLSMELRHARHAGSIRKNRIRYLLAWVFPSADMIGHRYPVVRRHPWLLPVFWPVRWVTALLFRRDNIRSAQQQQQSVSADRVRAQEASLRLVGLDFDFRDNIKSDSL